MVELGINIPNDTSSPSVEFRNVMKVVTASKGFTDNFYVRVEHRASARYLILQVFKRNYNDPVSVVATFTSTVSSNAAFDTLKGFSDGVNYTNGITIPTTLQKDFDTRITENFTLFSSFKQKIASATTDMGVPTNADATSDQMAANIRAIKTGKKTDRGTINIPALGAGATTSVSMVVYFKPGTVLLNLDGRYMVDGQLHGNDWANRHSVYDIRVIPYDSTNWLVTFFIRGGQFGAGQQYNYATFIE